MTSRHFRDPICGARSRRDQSGIALLATVLLLLVLASLGMASLNVVEKDQQVAGYLNRTAKAMHAADAAVAKALETLHQTGVPSVPVATLGDAALYPEGQPSYREHPSALPAIQNMGTGTYSGMGLQIVSGGVAQFQTRYWRVRVQGEAPGGSVAQVEVLTGSLIAN